MVVPDFIHQYASINSVPPSCVFDINAADKMGYTPLMVACTSINTYKNNNRINQEKIVEEVEEKMKKVQPLKKMTELEVVASPVADNQEDQPKVCV